MRRLVAWLSVSGSVALSAAACGEGSSSRRAHDPAGAGGGRALAAGGAAGGDSETVGGADDSAGSAAGGASGAAGAPTSEPRAGAGGEAPATSTDVHGRVRANLAAFSGVIVRIAGVQVETGADGTFTFEDVADEYQLILQVPEYNYVRVYDGVRTRSPIVNLGDNGFAPVTKSATVQGKISGGAPLPLAPDCLTQAWYLSNTRGHLQTVSFSPPNAFDVQIAWADEGDVDEGQLLVFQTVLAHGGGVTAFTGYGKRSLKIADGTLLGSLKGSPLTDVALADPEEYAVSGELSVPDGLQISSDMLRLNGWRTTAFLEPGPYSLTLPDIHEPKAVRLELFSDVGSARISWQLPDTATTDFALVVPELPLLVAPPADDVVTGSTLFSWNNLPDRSVVLVWMKVGDYTLERVTAEPSTNLPDLPALDIALPAEARGSWSVQAIGPASNVDELLVAQTDSILEAPTTWFSLESASRDFQLPP